MLTQIELRNFKSYEIGNHIAQLSEGGNRRRLATVFIKQVKQAIVGEALKHKTQRSHGVCSALPILQTTNNQVCLLISP